jgi:hypothetical protein
MKKQPAKAKKQKELQYYNVTLELMTPIECDFQILASSPEEAIKRAMEADWDDYEYGHPDGDGPTYCTKVADSKGNEIAVPRKYSSDTVNKENN